MPKKPKKPADPADSPEATPEQMPSLEEIATPPAQEKTKKKKKLDVNWFGD